MKLCTPLIAICLFKHIESNLRNVKCKMCLKCKGEGKRIKKLKQIVKKFPEMTSLTEVAIQSNLLSYSQRSPRSPHSYSYKKENRRMPFKSLNNLSLRRVLELQLDPSMLPLALMEEMSGRSNCKGCEH